jgi:carbamoyltransferase
MTVKPSYILGINAYDHDVSACLLRDGEIVCGIAKERITREKNATGFYQVPVTYCLEAAGISIDDLDYVVRNCYVLPVEDIEKRLAHLEFPHFMSDEERKLAPKNPLYLSKSDRVVTLSHHLAHAYSGFAPCPFDEGVIMVVDGVGSYRSDIMEPYTEAVDPLARESESYYRFQGSEVELLKKFWLQPRKGFLSDEFFNMAGLGALYSRVATYIFADWNKCGEVMGLAPYGKPGKISPLLHMEGDEVVVPDWGEELSQPFLEEGGENWEKSPKREHWQDLAWRVQRDTEEVLLKRAIWLRETTGAKNLVMAGGVALNCVANGRILREAGFENVWIQPAAGDDGVAIGTAYYGHLALKKAPRRFVMKHAYLGRRYDDEKVEKSASELVVRLQTKTHKSDSLCRDAAKLLAEGKIFGWFNGGSEFGPRALGNRSIIADPRAADMRDRLNKVVKHRQEFRPFAPIVLAERAPEIFEHYAESPFMLLALPVKPEWRERIPAVVHVDGTARLQTVTEDTNPVLYRLLKEFDALTGVPVLVNTSFNVKGEPIVETPADAINCFLGTGIDCLALQDRIMTKTRSHRIVSPLVNAYDEVSTMVRVGLSTTAPERV